MADLARAKTPTPDNGAAPSTGTPGQPVPAPSAQYQPLKGGGVFQASVPSNWITLPSKSSIRVVPENGYGPMNGQTVFSHGVEFGVTAARSRDLQQATDALINGIAQNNPQMRLAGDQRLLKISQRSAIGTPLVNPSPLGGQERIAIYTAFLADGNLFYYLTVAPESDAAALQATFQRIGDSIRLTDAR